jgi:hypothetical protein
VRGDNRSRFDSEKDMPSPTNPFDPWPFSQVVPQLGMKILHFTEMSLVFQATSALGGNSSVGSLVLTLDKTLKVPAYNA